MSPPRRGVSHPTASRVLNGGLENYPLREETILRVREAAARLNYRPNRFAQTLKTRRSHLIGISLGNFSDPGNPFDRSALEDQVSPAWADLIHGACQASWRRRLPSGPRRAARNRLGPLRAPGPLRRCR